MAKRKHPGPSQTPAAEDYYDLKTKAVDDLVNADESNSPEVTEEELERYGARKKSGIPNWLKVCSIKFWFPAAVCYFFFWGLGGYVADMLDLMFITAIVLGMVTDLLTNNAIRFFAPAEGGNDGWMMFPKKRFITFFLNIFYSFLLMFLVFCIYTGINMALIAITGASEDTVFLGVEPILFGVFYLVCDLLLTAGKNFLAAHFRRP